MHAGVQKLFDEHERPQHANRRDIHAQLAAVHRVVSDMQKQLIEYRALATAVDLSGEDHGLDGHLEHFDQTFGALERVMGELSAKAREAGKLSSQLDRYMKAAKTDVAATEARAIAAAAPEPEATS